MGDTWDSIDRYVVISSDTHAGAELHEYKGYLEKRWHDEFEQWAQAYSSPYDDLVDATANRNWDSDYRLKCLEDDGISAEVTFPNTIPPFFDTIHSFASLPWTTEDFERRLAGLRAHNRWLVDFCLQAPNRRRGMLQVMPHDVDLALEEIRWAKDTGVIAGVLAPAIPANHAVEPWFHVRYEPLWAELEELGLPFGQHPGTGAPDVGKDQAAFPAVQLVEFTWWTRRTFSHLILAGVFERYPNLKAVWTEQGVTWALQDLMLLDHTVADMKRNADNRTTVLFGNDLIESLSLSPSEYMRRNIYFGASFMSRPEAKYRAAIGVDHLMWGTDFPHEEGTTPFSREALRAAFHDVPEAELRQILAGTAAELYGFDLPSLVPVAQRVGPTVAEIGTPLEELPKSHSPAFMGAGVGARA
jgi:predicted TIM-barrel fold metal-dependent hydrolase